MGVLAKEISVPLPSCAVSCMRAHFPPPGLEDDFIFEGFKFADEYMSRYGIYVVCYEHIAQYVQLY